MNKKVQKALQELTKAIDGSLDFIREDVRYIKKVKKKLEKALKETTT